MAVERKKMQNKEFNVSAIEKKIGYVFNDKSLLIQAFTRSSFCNEHIPARGVRYQSNEVLEFFGDGVLSVAIISFLLKECTEKYAYGIKTDLDEGDFSNIKSKLSDKQNLSKSMKSLGLQKYLRMGEGDTKLGIENEPSVMEDLFESIVGAIYIDSNMSISAVIKSVSSMLDMSVYTNNHKPVQSAKNALQEWCADKKRRLPAPRYETLSEDGPDHKKTYMRGCYIGDRLVGRGIGKNFKLADAAAAEDALNVLESEESVSAEAEEKSAKEAQKKTSEPTELKNNGKKNDTPPTNKVKEATTAHKKKKAETSTSPTPETEIASVETKQKKEISPLAKLKAYASSQKKSSPVFKDLGEIKNGSSTECRVECIFLGETAVGIGASRAEARESATKLMIEKLGIGAKKKKAKTSSSAKKSSHKKSNTKKSEQAKTSEAAAQKAQDTVASVADQSVIKQAKNGEKLNTPTTKAGSAHKNYRRKFPSKKRQSGKKTTPKKTN